MFASMFLNAQNQPHPLEIISKRRISEPKNVVIFIHADWCKFCPAMKNYFNKDEKIQSLLKDNFYFADLNAEEKREINFSNKKYSFQPTGTNTGLHQLASTLGSLNGLVSYPTLIVLNPKNEIIFEYNGFLKATELISILEKLNKAEI